MQGKVMQKMLKVLELAAILNPEETDREVTDDKPTVFVHFYGHVARLQIDIHMSGWANSEPFATYDKKWDIRYDEERAEEQLDEVVELLENLVERWCKNG